MKPLPRPVVLKFRDQVLAGSHVTAGEFHIAMRHAEQEQLAVPDALVALSYLSEKEAYESLSAAVGMPLFDFATTVVSPLAIRLVPERVARRHAALAVAEDNRTLTYATANPFDPETAQDVSVASGRKAHAAIARPSQLMQALDRFYPKRTDLEEIPAPGPISSRTRVVIADDERMIRMLVRLLLQKEGYDVLEAEDGCQAIDLVQKHRPDLLITDLMMPNVDGYQVLRMLRADRSLAMLPVVVLTAESGPEVERTVLDLGADDYLVKPFEQDTLLQRVRGIFARQLRVAS